MPDFDADALMALLELRRTILPKRLLAPGPDPEQLQQILAAAACAPDHDQRLPWRFVLVPQEGRAALAQAFEQALLDRDPAAGSLACAAARDKAHRAPCLLLAVARLADPQDGQRHIPAAERLLSAGCAIQNLLLMATALGFGSALTSGQAMQSQPMRQLFSLGAQEQALCFISIGTPATRQPGKSRPAVADFFRTLEPPA